MTPSSSASEAVADRIAKREPSWLPIAGHVVNITVSLDERDVIVSALRASSEIERLRADLARERDKLATMTHDRDERWARQQAAEARAASAEAERDELRRANFEGAQRAHEDVDAITAQRDALAAKLAVMDAVLAPFADAANGLAPDLPATDQVLLTVGGLPIAWIYTDQLRRAREARAPAEEKG